MIFLQKYVFCRSSARLRVFTVFNWCKYVEKISGTHSKLFTMRVIHLDKTYQSLGYRTRIC